MSEKEIDCPFHNPKYCNPCSSPQNHTKCDLVQIGMSKYIDNLLKDK